MRKILFFILFSYSNSFAQVQLDIQYNGNSASTDISLYKYKEYITNSTEKVADNFSLSSSISKKVNLDLSQPSRLLVKDKLKSRKFYVQPGNKYELIFDDDSIYVNSADEINDILVSLESSITEYFKKNYDIELDDDKNKRKRTLALLEEFSKNIEALKKGTDFQKAVIEYRQADAISGTYYLMKDKKLFKQVETEVIHTGNIDFQNAAYMHFLLSYYFRKFQVFKFHNTKHPLSMSGYEMAKLEAGDLPDVQMRQVVMVNFIQKYYKSIINKDRKEAILLLDSLAEFGLHNHIRLASANLLDRYSKLEIGAEIPNFSMTDLQSIEIQLSDFKGKYVLLDFWFIGCAPCQRGVPYKKKLNEEFENCLDIVSINPINEGAAIAKYKDKDNMPWTFTMMDKNDIMLSELNVNGYPTYYLLNPEGHLLLNPEFEGSIENEFKLIEDELTKRCR